MLAGTVSNKFPFCFRLKDCLLSRNRTVECDQANAVRAARGVDIDSTLSGSSLDPDLLLVLMLLS